MKSELEFDRRAGVVAGLVSRKTGQDLSRRAGDARTPSASRLGCHVRPATQSPATKSPVPAPPEPSDSLE